MLRQIAQDHCQLKKNSTLWVDQFYDCCGQDQDKAGLARRQLYVAMTRAQDELHLFGSGRSGIIQELRGYPGIEAMEAAEAMPGNRYCAEKVQF